MKFNNYVPMVALLIFVATFVIFTTTTISFVSEKMANLPSRISITRLTTDCTFCDDLSSAKSAIVSENVKVLSETDLSLMSSEGKRLATKYGITHFPALIVTGKISKLSPSNYVVKDDALVYQTTKVPYVSVDGTTKGVVKVKEIGASSCTACMGVLGALNFLSQNGVYMEGEFNEDYTNASEMISKYGIKNVPAMILSDDLKEYPDIYSTLQAISVLASDNSLVYESQAPYFSLETQTVKGLVKIVYLSDKTCTDCYNVTIHQRALPGIGLFNQNEEVFLDVNDTDAQELIEKYNITKVPTVVISGEPELYDTFVASWKNYKLGTIEDDGTFVFRNMTVLGDAKFKEI